MKPEKIYKTIHQYSSEPVPAENMEKLLEIAADYSRVKNYVYNRFGGIGSLSKLYPGYTVQNEMTASGMRGELNLPSVYFYLAIFDALGDIKSQWARTKTKVLQLLGANENLNPEEKHYLRFVIKSNSAFEAVLNQKEARLPQEIEKKYAEVASCVDTEKLDRYLRRQVRKYHEKPHTDIAAGFTIGERAYRYEDHGIYIATKQKRKRVFVPLTDNNQYSSQLYIRLYPETGKVEIMVPVPVSIRTHEDFTNQVGIAFGMTAMLTTHEGEKYGEKFGDYQTPYADWIRNQAISYSRNRENNPGRKKYQEKKRRLEEQLHTYINQELNRFFRYEKPRTIYLVKLPKPKTGGFNKKINNNVALWQRGYIRNRLIQKCRDQSVELVEVFGKGISRECSRCGKEGKKEGRMFICEACGYQAEEKVNTARNTWNRGMKGETVGFSESGGYIENHAGWKAAGKAQ